MSAKPMKGSRIGKIPGKGKIMTHIHENLRIHKVKIFL